MRTIGGYLERMFLLPEEIEAWDVEDRLYVANTLKHLAAKLELSVPENKVRLVGSGSRDKYIHLLKWIRQAGGFSLSKAKIVLDNLESAPFEIYVSPEMKNQLIEQNLARLG